MYTAAYEIDFAAQAHGHGFHYRIGEMIGLDRTAKKVRLAAAFDDERQQVTPSWTIDYDPLGHRDRQHHK